MVTWTLLALALPSGPNGADALHVRATQLVQRLGDDRYREREKAMAGLLAIGFPAQKAIKQGFTSSDPEIQDRCKRLYPIIWRVGLEDRIARFGRDPRKGPVEGLPEIANWLRIAGDTEESRALYVTMVMNHVDRLVDLELNADNRIAKYTGFVRDHYTQRIGPRPAIGGISTTTAANVPEHDTLLMLFLGGDGPARPSTSQGLTSNYIYPFINSPAFAEKLRSSAAYRRLFAAWLARERYSLTLRRGIDIAAQNKVMEALPNVLQIARDPGAIPTTRAQAILGLGSLGDRSTIRELEPMLRDKTQITAVTVNGERGTVQVRDVALAASVRLAGKDYAEFGFERKPPVNLVTLSYIYFAFGNDDKRTAAFEKWDKWSKDNLKGK